MNCNSVFKLKSLTLEKLSAVAVAINVWELPTVKEKVHKLVVEDRVLHNLWKDWDKVIEYTVKQINFCLPEKLLCDIKDLVEVLGDKIYNWIRYLIESLKYDIKCTEKIYWTPCGEIDKLKIVKEYWLKNGAELGGVQHACYWKNPLLCIASAYAQEEFIHSHLKEMKDEIFKNFVELQLDPISVNCSDYGVMAIWLIFCQSKTKTSAITLWNKFKNFPDDRAAFILFAVGVKFGFRFLVQYCFDKMSYSIKQQAIVSYVQSCLNLCVDSVSYERENFLEILIFLIQNMNDAKQLEFLRQNFVSLFMKLVYMWPYQEVCLNLLLNDPSYLPGIHDQVLKDMMNDLCSGFYKLKYFGKGMYVQIFKSLWRRIPNEVKKDILTKDNYKCLRSLKVIISEILNFIINDLNLSDVKEEMIPIVEIHLKNLILNGGRYGDVNQLMRICSFKDKQEYNFLNTFLTTGQIKLAEEHLNWLGDSDSEKSVMKKQIDSLTICTILIKGGRYDFANEYLNWQCGDDGEQKNIKQIMISNGVLCDQVYQIWCMHCSEKSKDLVLSSVKQRCEILLRWFFESDEAAIKFRKIKLVENELLFIEKYWNNLYHGASFVYLGEFLQFCLWSPEKIEDLKRKIADDAEWWIDTYVAEKCNFEMVNSLFRWVFENDRKRSKVISNYMESPKGALLILKSFKNVNAKSSVRRLFNVWIGYLRPICISRIKMNLDTFCNGTMCESVISSIKRLFNEIENGYMVTEPILNNFVYNKMCSCNCLMPR